MKFLCRMWLATACAHMVLTFAVIGQTATPSIRSYLPRSEDVAPWQQVDSARLFVGEELYLLIDGGADRYLEYGFSQVVAAGYANSRGSSVKIEIYEMADAAAAYGIYSVTVGSQGRVVQIGNEGILYQYHLMFWKSHFLIFVSAADTAAETTAGIMNLARFIERKLGEAGEKPVLVQYLPQDGLASIKYLRGLIGLSSLYTFDTKNIFEVQEGVVGIYPKHTLFIFKYDSDKQGGEVFEKARRTLKTSTRFSNFKCLGDRCTMTDRKRNQLSVTCISDIIAIVVAEPSGNVNAILQRMMDTIRKR